MRVCEFTQAIVRAPAASVVDGLRAVDVGAPSFEGVKREHAAYVRALEEAGVKVEVLPAHPAYPDSLFVEDTALILAGLAIVLRPGAPSRAGEAAEIAPTLARRFAEVFYLDSGFVDGGDVLVTPRRVIVGCLGRTDKDGAWALSQLLEKRLGIMHALVRPPSKALHLKSECAMVDEETVMVTARMALHLEAVFHGLRIITVPRGEEAAANAIRVNDRLFIGAGYPRTEELLRREGYNVVVLDTREIAKIDAGLSCMSLRW